MKRNLIYKKLQENSIIYWKIKLNYQTVLKSKILRRKFDVFLVFLNMKSLF